MDDSSKPSTPSGRFGALIPRGGHLLALAVLIGALALVFATWHTVREREQRAAEAAFIAQTGEVADLLRQRLVQYELVVRGGASMFATLARPTPQQWRAYVDSMEVSERFPAMVGLGFAAFVRSGRIAELQTQWRDSGYGALEVYPRGRREFYGPILYLEPRTPENLSAVGYDMYSQPTRQAAMRGALESGQARLSGAVHLVQDGPIRVTGMLIYLPVYRNGERPASSQARYESMQGWVYIPFRMRRFVTASLGNIHRDARFRVYDVSDGEEVLLFTNAFGGNDERPAFRHSRLMRVYGRTWRLDFDSPPIAVAAPRLQALRNTLALGVLASLLMYALAWMLARTESRARTIAMRLTEDYRRSERRFRVAMHYSAIGQALLDSRGRIVEANPAMGLILGRSPESLAGVEFHSLFEDDDSALATRDAHPVIDAEGVRRVTRRLHHDDGAPRHAQLTYAPVPGNLGQDISGLVQVEDVTERLRAEARVHALNRTLEARVALRTRELSQANHELESFAYSVSHDLRAPLRAIEGFSRILSERYGPTLDDAARDYLGRVRRAASRMGELIDAMLKMSRLTRGVMKPETVDLSRMASEIGDELQVAEAGRRVQFVVQPGLGVVGDPTLLRNLLGNLLGNAWKFTRLREQACVEFGVTAPEEGGEFYVRDNGAGFSQDYVDKLFRPFQRLHSQEDFSGHGIGLATVKRIVERHGGTIRAEGREGEGATFYFTLRAEQGGADPA